MPQASIFAFARGCDMDPEGPYFDTRIRATDGDGTPLPCSQSMSSNVASMVLALAFPVVTKSPVNPRGEL
jgi:hypothetical protein